MSIKRFVQAQENTYKTALNEIKHGKKQSHWIWFIFPQIDGIVANPSQMNKYYSLRSLDEAMEYYADSLLKSRLLEITTALLENDGDIKTIAGETDAFKIRSCMTLFSKVDPDEKIFVEVVNKFYNGHFCRRTLDVLKKLNCKIE